MTLDIPDLKTGALDKHHSRLRDEASEDAGKVQTGPVTKKTQIIAIYGKAVSYTHLTLPTTPYV